MKIKKKVITCLLTGLRLKAIFWGIKISSMRPAYFHKRDMPVVNGKSKKVKKVLYLSNTLENSSAGRSQQHDKIVTSSGFPKLLVHRYPLDTVAGLHVPQNFVKFL